MMKLILIVIQAPVRLKSSNLNPQDSVGVPNTT